MENKHYKAGVKSSTKFATHNSIILPYKAHNNRFFPIECHTLLWNIYHSIPWGKFILGGLVDWALPH